MACRSPGFYRIPAWSGLAGPSVGHPAQPPAQAGSPRAGCTAPRPGGAGISPEKETPQPPWAACSSFFKFLFVCCMEGGVLYTSLTLPACQSQYFRLFLASHVILFPIHIVPTPPTSWTLSFTGLSPALRCLAHHRDVDKRQLLGDPSLRS